jgi:hypothetical protein
MLPLPITAMRVMGQPYGAGGYVLAVRMLLVLLCAAVLGAIVWFALGGRLTEEPVTKADIERAVGRRPRGNVQLVLCNEIFVPDSTPGSDPPQTWTCDTYLGPSAAQAQNGPSYLVTVRDDRIESIRPAPAQ